MGLLFFDFPASEEKKRREHFAIMAFIQSASAKEKVPEAVARYYLQEHGWNVDAALKEFNDDVNWYASLAPRRILQVSFL